jgi:hypothetical protein
MLWNCGDSGESLYEALSIAADSKDLDGNNDEETP